MAETYELAPAPPTPRLPGTVVVRETVDELIDAVAADLYLHALNCIRAFGDFQLALSGGSTPLPLYRRLMYDPAYRDLPWVRTHLWMVDERRVPFDDDRSNFKTINELIVDHSGIPPEQVHPICAMADDADRQYEALLRETLGWRERGQDRLDYVLLGMGADGHTASLFPRSPALDGDGDGDEDGAAAGELGRWGEMGERRERLVRINAGSAVTPPDRVTMTLRLINGARFVGVLVTGEGKRETVGKVARAAAALRARDGDAAAEKSAVRDLPILGVRPVGGEMRWYLDRAACPGG
jgi:6-phosphogluconolactonase